MLRPCRPVPVPRVHGLSRTCSMPRRTCRAGEAPAEDSRSMTWQIQHTAFGVWGMSVCGQEAAEARLGKRASSHGEGEILEERGSATSWPATHSCRRRMSRITHTLQQRVSPVPLTTLRFSSDVPPAPVSGPIPACLPEPHARLACEVLEPETPWEPQGCPLRGP